MFAGTFAPNGWALCNGQLLPIPQNQALYTLIGPTYGGDGINNFALPDLRSRVPIHAGTGTGLSTYFLGEQTGMENVPLTISNLPSHNHPVSCNTAGGNQAGPAGNLPAVESTGTSLDYSNAAGNGNMNAQMIGPIGGGVPHANIQPVLCVNFIIALVGVYPTQN